MTRAISYVRWSSAEQGKGDSARRQLEATERYCAEEGLTLDTGMSMTDRGVSGYTGANVRTGALGLFLEAVGKGAIPKGTVLIVEALDRISRSNLSDAEDLFRSILKAGIEVVVLRTRRKYTRASLNNPMEVSEMAWTFHLANLESSQKGERVRAAWGQKRKLAAAGVIQSRSSYGWLNVTDGKFHVVAPAADLVRRIFQWAADGTSLRGIVAKLVGIPCIGRNAHWTSGYVADILHNRAVLGELQPRTSVVEGGKVRWKDDGKLLPDHYPKIVTEALFYRAQKSLTQKARQRGRTGTHVANLFTGLLRDDIDGTPIHLTGSHASARGQYMVSSATLGGRRDDWVSFPYRAFERAFLGLLLKAIKPSDILPTGQHAQGEDQTAALLGKLTAIDGKIARAKTRLVDADDDDAQIDIIATLTRAKKTTAAKLEQVRAEQSSRPAETMGDMFGLLPLLDEADDDETRTELRRRIKAKLPQVVEFIRIRTCRENGRRACRVVVKFLGGVAVKFIIWAGDRHKTITTDWGDDCLFSAKWGKYLMTDYTGEKLGWEMTILD